MPYTSPFFSQTTGYTGEQLLIDDLAREQIKIYGLDVLYLPRYMLNLDTLLHESTKSAFEIAMPIPMYVKNYDGYDNGIEMLTKFGVRSSDEITMVMSRSEWMAYYAPFVKAYYNDKDEKPPEEELNPLTGQTARRPKEGDLLYFPFDDGIFEVKYVMFDQPFFQLGKGYIFELQCEKFEFSGENFSTGVTKVDDVEVRRAYFRQEFDLGDGAGTFKMGEKVTIYNTTTLEVPTDPDASPFKMWNDAGFLEEVPTVDATVMAFDKPRKHLIVGDLTNLNPNDQKTFANDPLLGGDTGGTEYPDDYYEAVFNSFDNVLIVGVNGAEYLTTSSSTAPAPFDDSVQIQSEFDKIKVLDISDQNPFGFY